MTTIREGHLLISVDAGEAIRREMPTLDTTALEQSDPFADVEDEDGLEENLDDYSFHSLLIYCHRFIRFVHMHT
jgi:hypothetical protein